MRRKDRSCPADGGGRIGRLFSLSRIRDPGLRRRTKRLGVSCPDRPPGLTGPACMMSGGNVHAAGASNRVRAEELCPKAVDCARRSSSVPAASAATSRGALMVHVPVIPSSGEEETSNGECQAPADRVIPKRRKEGLHAPLTRPARPLRQVRFFRLRSGIPAPQSGLSRSVRALAACGWRSIVVCRRQARGAIMGP